MAIVVSVTLFLMLMAGITLFGYKHYAKPARVIYEQLGAPLISTSASVLESGETEDGAVVRFLQQVGEKVPINPGDATLLRRDLIMAGYRSEKSVAVFYGIKIVMGAVLFLFALTFRDVMPACS
jgi:hypothetical protein